MHSLGFREFLLADDIFTSDQKWAGEVAEAITATGTNMLWTCQNGIRVESADGDLFQKMRRAGCYRVSFGFESGNDEVLKQFGKGGRALSSKGTRPDGPTRDRDKRFFSPWVVVRYRDRWNRQSEFDVPCQWMLKFGSTIAPGDTYVQGLSQEWTQLLRLLHRRAAVFPSQH